MTKIANCIPCSAKNAPWVLLVSILGSSLAFIDGTAINVALPIIQIELGASSIQTHWVVESYFLMLASLILVGGAFGDQIGRRRVFLGGVVVFTVASVLCGLSTSPNMLIAARTLQGIGGAFLIPGSLAVINSCFAEEKRASAYATWSAFTAITASIGPLLGGWLTDAINWKWVFLINLPIGILVAGLLLWKVPETRSPKKQKLDWTGAALSILGLGITVFALLEIPQRGFTSPVTASLLGIGVALIGMFLFYESRIPHPMMPLHLFGVSAFRGANILTFFVYLSLMGALYFFPFKLIQIQNYSPSAAGLSMLPFIVMLSIVSRLTGPMVRRWGPRLLLTIGPIFTSIGFFLLALPSLTQSFWTGYFPALLIMGMGMGLTVAPLTTVVMTAVSDDYAGTASGINNAVSRTAGLLGVALLGLLLYVRFETKLSEQLNQAQVSSATQDQVQNHILDIGALPLDQFAEEERILVKNAVGIGYQSGFQSVTKTAGAMAFFGGLIGFATIRRKR